MSLTVDMFQPALVEVGEAHDDFTVLTIRDGEEIGRNHVRVFVRYSTAELTEEAIEFLRQLRTAVDTLEERIIVDEEE